LLSDSAAAVATMLQLEASDTLSHNVDSEAAPGTVTAALLSSDTIRAKRQRGLTVQPQHDNPTSSSSHTVVSDSRDASSLLPITLFTLPDSTQAMGTVHCQEDKLQARAVTTGGKRKKGISRVKPDVSGVVPFPYIPQVYQRQLFGKTPITRLQVWKMPILETNWLMMDKDSIHYPQSLRKIMTTPSQVYSMKCRAINIPDTDDQCDSRPLQTFEQLLKTGGSHLRLQELAFLDQMRNHDLARCSSFQLETLYMMDMRLDVWDRLPDGSHVKHFLNTNLFNHGQRLSLMTLMDSDTFAGFDSAFIYCKLGNSFFKMHVEQLFAPFYNYCWQGSTVWYAVMEEDRQAFMRFLIDKVGEQHNIGQVTAEEEKLFLALLYSKQIFLDPFDLHNAGVPVYRVCQRENQIIIGSGTVIHWGKCGDDAISVNEAVNYLPVRWLIDGLPQLVQHVQWLRHYIEVDSDSATLNLNQALRDTVFNSGVRRMVSHHMPLMYTKKLCQRILWDTTKPPFKCDYTGITQADMGQCRNQLNLILDALREPAIINWYNENN
jgi:JmjC domain, hydroxylase